MNQDHDLLKLANKIQYDLTAVKTNLSELIRQLAATDLPAPRMRVKCRHCGLSFAGERTLAEHLYHQHDGPEPEHWLEAEKRSATSEHDHA